MHALLLAVVAGVAAGEVGEPVEAFSLVKPSELYIPVHNNNPFQPYNPDVVVRRSSSSDSSSFNPSSALFGLAMFIFAFPLLWANERRQAKMWQLFGRAAKIVRGNVKSDPIDENFNNNLVHTNGVTATREELEDSVSQVSVQNSAKLVRKVEMYQWVESKSTSEQGGEKITTYEYSKAWRSEHIDSSRFDSPCGHENPSMPVTTQTWTAKDISFGAFKLPEKLIDRLGKWKHIEKYPDSLTMCDRFFKKTGPGCYSSETGATELGDLRIEYQHVPCGPSTVLAVQVDDTFAPMLYTSKVSADGKVLSGSGLKEPLLNDPDSLLLETGEGGCCKFICDCVEEGEEVFEIAESTQTLQDIFKNAQKKQQLLHKVLMISGYLMLVYGLYIFLDVFPTVLGYIPLIGRFLEAILSFFTALLSFLLGTACFCVTVGLAWLAQRPAKAGILLAVAAACVCIPVLIQSQQSVPQ